MEHLIWCTLLCCSAVWQAARKGKFCSGKVRLGNAKECEVDVGLEKEG